MSITLRQSLHFEPKELSFGTSGLRGRVTDLSQLEVATNTLGFLRFLASADLIRSGDAVWLAGDLRPSTSGPVEVEGHPRGEMLHAVAWAVTHAGYQPAFLGLIPSPALMAYALSRHQASIMVTGSHIPFDRNGIKFNKPDGEVLKADEASILQNVRQVRDEMLQQAAAESAFAPDGQLKPTFRSDLPREDPAGRQAYLERYLKAFPVGMLKDRRLLVYQHSAVGRDLLVELLQQLGANVVPVGRSDQFIPVDTEAVQLSMLQEIQQFADNNGGRAVEAVVSTDGDSDRPLLLGVDDGRVRFFGGDLLGIVTADFFGARHVTVPISANDAVDRFFGPQGVQIVKTRIGSPHVIASMQEVGWEANGGFLTARPCSVPGGGTLPPLPTRDAFVPLLAALYASLGQGMRVVDCFAKLPQRFGKADVVRSFPPEISLGILQQFSPADSRIEEVWLDSKDVRVRSVDSEQAVSAAPELRQELRRKQMALQTAFSSILGGAEVVWINYCDGCRFSTTQGEILHLRPSGNAPEQRVYAVADSPDRAEEMVQAAIGTGGVIEQLRGSFENESSVGREESEDQRAGWEGERLASRMRSMGTEHSVSNGKEVPHEPRPRSSQSGAGAPHSTTLARDPAAPEEDPPGLRVRRPSAAFPSDERSEESSASLPPILRLHGIVQHYDWGGTTFIPELLHLPNPERNPYAELWLGAHPSASGRVTLPGKSCELRQIIQQHGPEALGPRVVEIYGSELPYLLKILDAQQMLSIQAHPNRAQAQAGFAREQAAGIPLTAPTRNYKDPHPKPEVHVALTPFYMLHGFRRLEAVLEETQRHPELTIAWPNLADALQQANQQPETRRQLLKTLYERVMRLPQSEVDAILRPLLDRLQRQPIPDKSDPMFWLRRAAESFAPPGTSCDRGLFSFYLLNLVELEPGQSTFQDAGVLHAYLEGATVELMASSDNVLRGGLTSKHVDVEELLRIVHFEEQRPAISTGTPMDPQETVFQTTATEFELSRCVLQPNERWTGSSRGGPDCLLVVEGTVDVSAATTTERFTRGQSAWLNWGVDYAVNGGDASKAVVFRASVPEIR
jgi:phosphomannomutase